MENLMHGSSKLSNPARIINGELPSQEKLSSFFQEINNHLDCDYMVLGSFGRRLSTRRSNLRIGDHGVLDVDIAIPDPYMNWTELTSFAADLHLRFNIALDPHYYIQENGTVQLSDRNGQRVKFFPQEWFKSKDIDYAETKVRGLRPSTHLLLLSFPLNFRSKDLPEFVLLGQHLIRNKDRLDDIDHEIIKEALNPLLDHPEQVGRMWARYFYQLILPRSMRSYVRERLKSSREKVSTRNVEGALVSLAGEQIGIKFGYQSNKPVYLFTNTS